MKDESRVIVSRRSQWSLLQLLTLALLIYPSFDITRRFDGQMAVYGGSDRKSRTTMRSRVLFKDLAGTNRPQDSLTIVRQHSTPSDLRSDVGEVRTEAHCVDGSEDDESTHPKSNLYRSLITHPAHKSLQYSFKILQSLVNRMNMQATCDTVFRNLQDYSFPSHPILPAPIPRMYPSSA